MSLRNAHALAIMTQYRIGMTHLETVTSLGLVTQIELALITYFRESLPEPGQNWDSQKRAREIERRLARLRWVEQEQEREDSGLKGVWNRVRGRGRPSGKELYERMVKNADTMIMGMQELDRDDDVLGQCPAVHRGRPGGPGVRGIGPPVGDEMTARGGVESGCVRPVLGVVFRASARWPGIGLKKAPERTGGDLAVWL